MGRKIIIDYDEIKKLIDNAVDNVNKSWEDIGVLAEESNKVNGRIYDTRSFFCLKNQILNDLKKIDSVLSEEQNNGKRD